MQVTQFGNTAFSVFYGEFHLFLILYAGILAIDYTLESRRRLAQRETEAARLSEQLSRTQLAALRRQLEPHFFFNTLNAIAGLVRENRNDDAVSMIAGLSDLLRRVLDDSGKQEVSLGEEMEFLETYLEIQKTRFAERLRLSVNVPKELLSARVPSLILQPMVENAIEHGIEKRASGGLLRIGAVRDNGFLTLSVYNEGPRFPEDWEQRRAGVGIANVRSPLAHALRRSQPTENRESRARRRSSTLGTVQTQMSSEAAPVGIRVLVVDDEPLARSNILHLLRANPEVEILGECDSAAASPRRDPHAKA